MNKAEYVKPVDEKKSPLLHVQQSEHLARRVDQRRFFVIEPGTTAYQRK